MFDRQSIAAIAELSNGRGHVAIAACKSNSGAVKEIAYSPIDRCFFVTVNGRERLRSDVPETAYSYFDGGLPD